MIGDRGAKGLGRGIEVLVKETGEERYPKAKSWRDYWGRS